MEIVIAILASCLAVAILVIVAQLLVIVKLNRAHTREAADKVVVKHGTRYAKTDTVVLDGKPQVGLRPHDLVLTRGETYTVGKKFKILPGQYTVLAADESMTSVTISVDDVVKTYEHNSHLVLADGAVISPRSGSVILR